MNIENIYCSEFEVLFEFNSSWYFIGTFTCEVLRGDNNLD